MRLLFVFLLMTSTCAGQITPINHGHAHNDYVHLHPLYEALENGFTSIEIDVHFNKNELKVAHGAIGLSSKPTIQQLYLEPVKKIIEQNGGSVYKNNRTPIIFMIDFKTAGETYSKLKEVLNNYRDIIAVYKGDSLIKENPIRILISGNAPVNEILKEETSLCTVDAGIAYLNNDKIDKAVTRYSSSWGNYFTWRGFGKMPAAQKDKLWALVAKAHSKKKQIRFYHIPDKPNVWKTLLSAGVDWINTNKLKAFNRFMQKEKSRK
jgi:glycerophosphoryl diester phosphodiesterase